MISTPQQHPAAYRRLGLRRALARAQAALCWPFTNRYAALLWLALRLYAGSIFLQYGLSKLQAGWLTSDPITPLLLAVANGALPTPLPFFRAFAGLLVSIQAGPALAVIIPCAEVAAGLAFLSGVLVVPAAIGVIILLAQLLLGGIGTLAYEGRLIVLMVLFILAARVVGVIGVQPLLVRGIAAVARPLRRETPH